MRRQPAPASRILVALAAGVAVVLGLAGWAPSPKPKPAPSATGIGSTVSLAADSTLTLTSTTYLSGPLQKPDSIRWTVYRNLSVADSLVAVVKDKPTTRSFAGLTAPQPGDSVALLIYSRVYRDQTPNGKFASDTVRYRRPEAPLPPPPTVDSVKAGVQLVPASATIPLGGSVDFLARPS